MAKGSSLPSGVDLPPQAVTNCGAASDPHAQTGSDDAHKGRVLWNMKTSYLAAPPPSITIPPMTRFPFEPWVMLFFWILPLASHAADRAKAAAGVRQIIAHRGASLERPECTMASVRRAIDVGATAVEVDVRTSADGKLFILHDATLNRTTNGKGAANKLTLAQLQQLNAGSWFDKKYKGERIPSLAEALAKCRGKVDILLDLKEQGDVYDRRVAADVKKHGDPARTIIGVRSVAQAQRFRALLPKARQWGLIPNTASIEPFAKAGVEIIRLWPRWIKEDAGLVPRVAVAGAKLHLNGTNGSPEEVAPLLKHAPFSLSSDDPKRLVFTLKAFAEECRSRPRAR